MAMSTSAECRKHAEECVESAQTATNEHHRKLLLEMAEKWQRLAADPVTKSASTRSPKNEPGCATVSVGARSAVRAQYLDLESPFKPEELKAMTTAFERVILTLDLENRPDLTLPLIGATLIRITKQGEFNPAILCERTVAALSNAADKVT
jgi:hypothetical protein